LEPTQQENDCGSDSVKSARAPRAHSRSSASETDASPSMRTGGWLILDGAGGGANAGALRGGGSRMRMGDGGVCCSEATAVGEPAAPSSRCTIHAGKLQIPRVSGLGSFGGIVQHKCDDGALVQT
jgi:hypothetical protein